MAEILLTASVELLLEKLLSPGTAMLMKKLFGGGKKYRKMMEEWKIELSNIKALLADAERQQCSSEEVKKWLEEVQDVAFDMEDLLADFQIQIQDRQISMANASGVIGCLKNMAKKHLKIKLKNLDKMDGITERLQSIHSRREAVGLSVLSNMQHHIPLTEALRMQRETTSVPSKGNVLGRDKEKQRIVNELLNGNESDENYLVIPIVGNGGIGKTTLAQSIYNDEKLCDFDLKAWVCVSDVFDVTRITTTIYKAVKRGTVVDFGTLDEAQTQLKEVLMGKKFLIVLDDIWNEEYSEWEKLQKPFQYATKGSRVIMTTRNNDIARMMKNRSDNNITSLESLSDNDIWCVFQQHANDDLDLAELRDDIIKKCKGLPLAAKVLGGILKQKVNIKQCRMVLENDSWSNEEKGILPVLRLSYHYLPSHLKRVFAYCSVLPKDYEFSEREIIILWMAQGFLLENQEGRMEDLGHHYFNDLKSRSLFEQSLDDGDRFIMHDLTHDLALWAAGGICYEDNKTQADKRQRVRHVYFTKCDDSTLESQLRMASQLRTFFCGNFTYVENLNIIKEFSYVRTLCLGSRSNEVVPECIGELRHLRFLSLEFDMITELSISINKLWNLQTLSLKGCDRLVKIPNISSLGKLRHLEISQTSLEEMPLGFEKLTNLRSLDIFVLGHGRGNRLMELKQLNHLQGKLTICGLENVTMSEYSREAHLHEKCRLDKLVLEWENERDEVDDVTKKEVVEQLKPHDSIKECKFKGFKGLALPSWLGDPCFNNMVNVSLIDCEKCERLPPLGQLPQLENLYIERMNSIVEVGHEFYGDRSMCTTNPFPTLKRLRLKKMESLKRWLHVDKDRAFPCLEHLEILWCKSLKGDIPPHLPSLKKLHIHLCEQLSVSVQLQSLPLLEELEAEKCKIVLESINTSASEGDLKEEHGIMSTYPQENNPCELPHLTSLIIKRSPSLISLPNGMLLPALKTLQIMDCPELESFEDHALPPQLEHLRIMGCLKLQMFLEGGIPFPTNLKDLEILHVKMIWGIQASGLHRLHSLKWFVLKNVNTEEDLSLPSCLSRIDIIGNQNVKNVSVVDNDGTNTTTPLTDLCIRGCPNLEFVAGNFTSLTFLSLTRCPNLKGVETREGVGGIIDKPMPIPIREWGLHLLNSLKELHLEEIGGSCTDAVSCIQGPDDLQLPSSLWRLNIWGFQNLKSIRWSTLPNLMILHIWRCPQLESESFADTPRPPRLQKVIISECD